MVVSDPRKFSSMLESEGEPLTSLNLEDLIFIHLDLCFQLCIRCHMPLPYSPCFLPPGAEQPLLPHVSINMMLCLTLSKVIEPVSCRLKPETKTNISSFVVFFQYFMTVKETWLTQSYRWHFIFYWKNHILHTYLYKNSHRSGTARYKTYMYHPKLSKGRTSS